MEKEVSELDRKLFLKKAYLERVNYYLSRSNVDLQEFYAFVRKFFSEFLKLDYEFTYEELSLELNKVFIRPKVKEDIDDFLLRLSESEYLEEESLSDKDIIEYLKEFGGIVSNLIYEETVAKAPETFMSKVLRNRQKGPDVVHQSLKSLVEEAQFYINSGNVEAAKKSYISALNNYDALGMNEKKTSKDTMDRLYDQLQELIKNPIAIQLTRGAFIDTTASTQGGPDVSTDSTASDINPSVSGMSPDISSVNAFIDETSSAILTGDVEIAKKSYVNALNLYETLDAVNRLKLHSSLNSLYTKLQDLMKHSDSSKKNISRKDSFKEHFLKENSVKEDSFKKDLPEKIVSGSSSGYRPEHTIPHDEEEHPERARREEPHAEKPFSKVSPDVPVVSINDSDNVFLNYVPPDMTSRHDITEKKDVLTKDVVMDDNITLKNDHAAKTNTLMHEDTSVKKRHEAVDNHASRVSRINIPASDTVNALSEGPVSVLNDNSILTMAGQSISNPIDDNINISVEFGQATKNDPASIVMGGGDKTVQKESVKDIRKDFAELLSGVLQGLDNDDLDGAQDKYNRALQIYRSMENDGKIEHYNPLYATYEKLDEAMHKKSLHELLNNQLDGKLQKDMSSIDGTKSSRSTGSSGNAKSFKDNKKVTDTKILKGTKNKTGGNSISANKNIVLENYSNLQVLRIYELLEGSYLDISNTDIPDAKLKYFQALEIYHNLPLPEKKKAYEDIYSLFKRLSTRAGP